MTPDEWNAHVGDEEARATDEVRRGVLMDQLEEAERLLFDEGYTTDDPWPGIIYRPGHDHSERRVSVETWVMMRALVRGMGEASIRRDKASTFGGEPKPCPSCQQFKDGDGRLCAYCARAARIQLEEDNKL